MVEPITFQTIFQFLQTVGILTAVFYYITTLRNAERAKNRDLLFQRIQSFDKPFSLAWGDVMSQNMKDKKWDDVFDPRKNLSLYANMTFLRNRYQMLGLMLKENYIESDLLFRMYNPKSIMHAWTHYEKNINDRRTSNNQPYLFSDFEYLANEAKKRHPEIILNELFEFE